MTEEEKAPRSLAAVGAQVGPVHEPSQDYSTLAAALLPGYPEMGTPDQAAYSMQLPPDKVRQLCREGSLRAIKVGKLWRIPRAWLAEFILNGGTAGDS